MSDEEPAGREQLNSTFTPTGLGFVYTVGDQFDDELVTIEVNNLRTRGGSTYALLSASTKIQGARRIPGSDRVLNAEVWLLNEKSRVDYASALAALIPAPPEAMPLNFTSVLEELAQRVIDYENAPPEVVTLDEVTPRARTAFLVQGLIPAGKPTILYGPGGVGKSILAAGIATAVEAGVPFLKLATQQGKVLYLDWETDEGDIAARMVAASQGMGLKTVPKVHYVSLVRPIEDAVAQLARVVAEEHIALVIIDSVGMAMANARDGSDPSEGAIRFFRALRGLDTAVLAIDHVSGDDMRRGKGSAKPYGSVYKWNSARYAFELRERKPPSLKGSHLLLKHRKSNLGPQVADLAFVLRWDNMGAVFYPEGMTTTPTMPLDQQILDVLKVAPATPRQIAELLSDDDNYVGEYDVRRSLRPLIDSGKVQSMADGQMRVPPAP